MGGKKKDKKKSEKKAEKKLDKPEKMSWAELTGPTRDIVQVPFNWAEMVSDDDDEVEYVTIDRTNLPKAPRGAQEVPIERIPTTPPFQLYMSGIPFTATEDKVLKFFEECKVIKINMGTESGRNRGNAVIEFEDRTSLINALKKDDAVMGNRQVHLSLDNPKDRNNINRLGEFRSTGGLPSGTTMTSFPDDWRSTLRKKPDIASSGQNFPGSSSFQSFNRFNKFGESNPPYRGRFSDDGSRSGRMFSSTGNSNMIPGFKRENSFDSRPSSNYSPNIPTDSRSATSTDNPSQESVRKVDPNALKALLSMECSSASERSKSIFGNAKPVDSSNKINEAMQKLNSLQIQETHEVDNRRPSAPQLDRPSYRSSRSEDFRSAGRNQIGSMSTYNSRQQKDLFVGRQGNIQHKPPLATDSKKVNSLRNGGQPKYSRQRNEVSSEFPSEDNLEFNKSDWSTSNSDMKNVNYVPKNTYKFTLTKNRFSSLKAEDDEDDQST